MNRRRALSISAITAIGLAFSLNGVTAQTNQIVGTYTLVDAGNAYGTDPKGSAYFDSNGRFAIILMRNNLPRYASNNRTQGTSADYKATVEGSLAYFGTYSVSGTDLNSHIEGSTFPNWTGMEQKRINLMTTADELRYTQPNPSGGGAPAQLIWRRAK
jgi:Lipocalin-like domain